MIGDYWEEKYKIPGFKLKTGHSKKFPSEMKNTFNKYQQNEISCHCESSGGLSEKKIGLSRIKVYSSFFLIK